jgi:hypothetical protein
MVCIKLKEQNLKVFYFIEVDNIRDDEGEDGLHELRLGLG